MILKYELPPLGCAALGAPSLDVGGGVSNRNRIFRYPSSGTVYPSRPRTFLFSTGFCYIESRVKLAISDTFPPPPALLLSANPQPIAYFAIPPQTQVPLKNHTEKRPYWTVDQVPICGPRHKIILLEIWNLHVVSTRTIELTTEYNLNISVHFRW